MQRDIWKHLDIFAAVAQAGSFTRAAALLEITPSALSHAVKELEARLGMRLLNRSTRSLAPTEAGERLLASLGPAMASLDQTLQSLESQRQHPAGRIRISAHRSAAVHLVQPRMARVAARYPDVTVELVVDDGFVDIVAGRFDAGIRRHESLEQDMVAVRLDAGSRICIVAAPSYLAQAGTPQRPEDLLAHRCLNYRFPSALTVFQWMFERDGESSALATPGNFITNDIDVLLGCALAGAGIAYLVEPQAAPHLRSGALIRLLEDWSPTLPPNYLYYSGRGVTRALAAFIDAMKTPLE